MLKKMLLILFFLSFQLIGMEQNIFDFQISTENTKRKRLEDDKYKYQCSLCPAGNDQKGNVKDHILTKHSMNPEVRIIDLTGTEKKFIEVKDLGKTYDCNVCEKIFKTRRLYREHFATKMHKTALECHKNGIGSAKFVAVKSKKAYCHICDCSITTSKMTRHLKSKLHIRLHLKSITENKKQLEINDDMSLLPSLEGFEDSLLFQNKEDQPPILSSDDIEKILADLDSANNFDIASQPSEQ